MSADSYLQKILAKYAVEYGDSSPSSKVGNKIFPVIKNWAGVQLNEVSWSGSYAKRTAVKGSTDVDMFISLKSDTPMTLEEIYNSLHERLTQDGYTVRKQNVSIGVTLDGMSLDLIPARKQSGNTNYHSLWKNKQKTWIQTNISNHIDKIKNSGRIDEIKITKIWRNLNNLEFPSFYLELSLLEALHGKNIGDLASNVLHILNYLSKDFTKASIVDPANSNNIISEEISDLKKCSIALAAISSRGKNNWEEIVW